jgi:hypothetical protein
MQARPQRAKRAKILPGSDVSDFDAGSGVSEERPQTDPEDEEYDVRQQLERWKKRKRRERQQKARAAKAAQARRQRSAFVLQQVWQQDLFSSVAFSC